METALLPVMDTSVPALTCQRQAFDVPDDVLYLNAASKSVLLSSSVAAGRDGAGAKGHPWSITESARYSQAETIRTRFAALIGAGADDIAIQPAASYGIATAAKNIAPPRGSRILVLEGQFPSNVYAWMNSAVQSGAELVTVAWPEDDDWTAAVMAHIDERVSVAALPPCHWTDGATLDLTTIGKAVKDVGATFVVDATQWAGAAPLDVQRIGADYLVCAAYKWLLGPYGLSLMYVASARQDGTPLEDHLFNHGGVDSITGGLGYPSGFTAGARRFDAGQYLNLITLPMIEDALGRLNDWQPARIAAYLAPVTDALADVCVSLGLEVTRKDMRSPHIVGIRRAGGFTDADAATCAAAGTYVSARGGALRLSPYLFNTPDDANRLRESLRKILKTG